MACLAADSPRSPIVHQQWTPRQELQHPPIGTLNHSSTASDQHAVLVPTYSVHRSAFCLLLHSLLRNIRTETPLLFVSVFSTPKDRINILGTCGACSFNAVVDVLHMQSLVFSPPPRFVNFKDKEDDYAGAKPNFWKFNFQTAKKLWALAQLRIDKALVLDSDFLLVQPVRLVPMIERYARVLFETTSVPNGLDEQVLRSANQLLGTQAKGFPMEPPWIFEPRYVRHVLRYVYQRAQAGHAASKGVPSLMVDPIVLLLRYPGPIFEVCVHVTA